MNLRALAARVILAVSGHGHTLTDALDNDAPGSLPVRDRALVHELCYGVMRWYPRLQAQAALLMESPLRRRDQDVHCLILAGLYQLQAMRIPAHAAVSETVAGARTLKKPWASKLINAVLRNYQRDAGSLAERCADDPVCAHAHPDWLLKALQSAWPQDWPAIVAANNSRAPMTLRVNAACGTREVFLQMLGQAQIEARPAAMTDYGVILDAPLDVTGIPGFDAGRVSVQDAAAQLASGLLELQPGQRVLDACAAPGGKTAACLEQQPGLATLVAVDNDRTRLARVEQNLVRLGLTAQTVCADAAQPADWWDRQAFDRILLDAPCSATGVIRRHPDIKLLRRENDVRRVVGIQATLLEQLWPLLTRGGMLLSATCSILPDENEQQINRFLRTHDDARTRVIEASWGAARTHGRYILPGNQDMDGFYYARVEKL